MLVKNNAVFRTIASIADVFDTLNERVRNVPHGDVCSERDLSTTFLRKRNPKFVNDSTVKHISTNFHDCTFCSCVCHIVQFEFVEFIRRNGWDLGVDKMKHVVSAPIPNGFVKPNPPNRGRISSL